MSIAFSMGEIIKIAVGIEKQGVVFYDVMARSTKQPDTRNLFIQLADAERLHMETFSKMMPEPDTTSTPVNEEPPEYSDYLKALVNNAVFTDEMATSDLATRIESDVEALNIGINAEKDSILFYYHIKEVMPSPVVPLVDKIIEEEKLHIRRLNEMKNKISGVK